MKKSFASFIVIVFMLLLHNSIAAQVNEKLEGKWIEKNNGSKNEQVNIYHFLPGGSMEFIKKKNEDLTVQNGSWVQKGDSLTITYYKGIVMVKEAKKDYTKLPYGESGNKKVEKTERFSYKRDKNVIKMVNGKRELILTRE